MTTKLEQAARQALGALVRAEAMYGQPNADIQTALRKALAEQAEQEPGTISCECGDIYERNSFGGRFIKMHGICPNCDAALQAAPVRTKDLTEPLIDELRECRDLLMCVESCSRNNFENLAYERVQAIDEVIAADRRKNK